MLDLMNMELPGIIEHTADIDSKLSPKKFPIPQSLTTLLISPSLWLNETAVFPYNSSTSSKQ